MMEEYLAWLLGLGFIAAGIIKVAWTRRTRDDAMRWGYLPQFLIAVGVVEIVAGAALFWPGAVLVAALPLVAIMLGAIWTAVSHRHWLELIHPTLFLAGLVWLILLVR